MVIVATQKCRTCAATKPISEFWLQRGRRRGLQSECKNCMRRRNNNWQRKHLEHRTKAKMAGIVKKRKSDPQYAIWKAAKDRARKSEIEFDLHASDVSIPIHCPILGVRLESGMGKGRGHAISLKDTAPSIDRVDNSRGYTIDNIIVVSFRANRIKSDASWQELLKIARFYEERAMGIAARRGNNGGSPESRGAADCLSEVFSSAEKEARLMPVGEA